MNVFDSTLYPTEIPVSLTVGDRWAWKIAAGDYGTGYTLGYTLTPAAGGAVITLASSLSGTDYLFEIAAATTAAYTAGDYRYAQIVTRSSDSQRATLTTGTTTLAVNPVLSTADTRSHARKTLDAIRATIEGRASIDQQSMAINGRSISRTPITELIALESRYASLVAREEMAENLAVGRGRRNPNITVRMS